MCARRDLEIVWHQLTDFRLGPRLGRAGRVLGFLPPLRVDFGEGGDDEQQQEQQEQQGSGEGGPSSSAAMQERLTAEDFQAVEVPGPALEEEGDRAIWARLHGAGALLPQQPPLQPPLPADAADEEEEEEEEQHVGMEGQLSLLPPPPPQPPQQHQVALQGDAELEVEYVGELPGNVSEWSDLDKELYLALVRKQQQEEQQEPGGAEQQQEEADGRGRDVLALGGDALQPGPQGSGEEVAAEEVEEEDADRVIESLQRHLGIGDVTLGAAWDAAALYGPPHPGGKRQHAAPHRQQRRGAQQRGGRRQPPSPPAGGAPLPPGVSDALGMLLGHPQQQQHHFSIEQQLQELQQRLESLGDAGGSNGGNGRRQGAGASSSSGRSGEETAAEADEEAGAVEGQRQRLEFEEALASYSSRHEELSDAELRELLVRHQQLLGQGLVPGSISSGKLTITTNSEGQGVIIQHDIPGSAAAHDAAQQQQQQQGDGGGDGGGDLAPQAAAAAAAREELPPRPAQQQQQSGGAAAAAALPGAGGQQGEDGGAASPPDATALPDDFYSAFLSGLGGDGDDGAEGGGGGGGGDAAFRTQGGFNLQMQVSTDPDEWTAIIRVNPEQGGAGAGPSGSGAGKGPGGVAAQRQLLERCYRGVRPRRLLDALCRDFAAPPAAR